MLIGSTRRAWKRISLALKELSFGQARRRLPSTVEIPALENVTNVSHNRFTPQRDNLSVRSLFRPKFSTTKDCRFHARDYRGSRDRQYRLFIPSHYNGKKPLPLVMLLHGCEQTHLDMEKISNLTTIAEREGFIALYPYITSYTGMRIRNCWGWWMPSQTRAGAGEVEDLWQMLEEVREQYQVDDRRIHVAGLSAGAGMAVALMVTRCRSIASGATVAGVAYGESAHAVNFVRQIAPHFRSTRSLVESMEAQMAEGKSKVPLFIVHSRHDSIVNIRASKNLRDTWASCFGVPLKKVGIRSGEAGGSHWHHTRYRSQPKRTDIETLWLDGPDHGWYGGRPGQYSYPKAVDISEMIWDFFKNHPKEKEEQ